MDIDKIILGAINTFPDSIQSELLSENILKKYSINNNITVDFLFSCIQTESNPLLKSVLLKSVIGVKVFSAQKNESSISSSFIYPLIYDSLIELEEDHIIGRIGSQGFLSIPIIRIDEGKKSFNLLRLHIWDDSLDAEINPITRNYFTIHSHQFYARSWILTGEIFNHLYSVKQINIESNYCFFDIDWKNKKTKVNERVSLAINQKKFADVQLIKSEKYRSGQTYSVKEGDFHASSVNRNFEINSTLFLFSSLYGRVNRSFVLGPSDIDQVETNRSKAITVKPLLEKLKSVII